MIKVNKGEAPEFLYSDKVILAQEKIEKFYSSTHRDQKRYTFPFEKEIDKELKKDLHKRFNGKCGYCEIAIQSPEYGTIDRFRPHNGVRDKKKYFKDLYWWLAYDWDNLIYSCCECNQFKANYFPLNGSRSLSREVGLQNEFPLLLNPCIEEPSLHFMYDKEGNIIFATDQGSQTIDLLRLNRTDLIEKRLFAKNELIRSINELIFKGRDGVPKKQINQLISIFNRNDHSIEFLAFKSWIIHIEIKTTPFLGQILGIELEQKDNLWIQNFQTGRKIHSKNIIHNDYFPIEYIHIKNFKAISDLRISFKEDDISKKSWLFLLGENGVGKSSILQAIAIGLNANKPLLEPMIHNLISKGKPKCEITIKERNSKNIIKTELFRKEKSLTQIGKFDSFLIGYGSLRLSKDEVETQKSDFNKISYDNLFKPILPLNDITKWLKNTYRKDVVLFNRIAYSIKQLLPIEFNDNELSVQKEEIIFKNSKEIKTFSELSDGFKSTIILAIDIMMKLSSAHADMDKMFGIVIIDELGNQLHPRWQMSIVKQLRCVFPNINFIISTHHPLCLRGAEKEEIHLIKNFENEVYSITELMDPSLMRVDQILSSEFFGLNSLIDPELEAKFNLYYELLGNKSNLNNSKLDKLTELKNELKDKKQLGSSLRDELMYTVIDELLSQKVMYSNKSIIRKDLKNEAIIKVREIWEQNNLSSDDLD